MPPPTPSEPGDASPGEILLELRQASARPGRERVLFDIDWTLRRGEHWAVLGANGAGKSVLLRLLRGEIWPDEDPARPASVPPRRYRLAGVPQTSPLGLRQRLPLVSPALHRHVQQRQWKTDGRELVEAGLHDDLLRRRPDGAPLPPSQERRVQAALELTGAATLAERPLARLSQGQLRLLLLARALAAIDELPAVLFLDEGLEGLDAPGRTAMLRVLDRLLEQRGPDGLSLVCAGHRPEDLPRGLTHALTLDRGRLVSQGPLAPRGLWAPATPPPAPPLPAAMAEADAPSLPGLFRLRRVDVHLDGVHALRGVDWTAPPPREGRGHWAILGPNGAGKTTLFRLLRGELSPATTPHGGELEFPAAPTPLARRQAAALVSPALEAAWGYDSPVLEVALSGFHGAIGLWDPPSPEQTAEAMAWLARFGLKGLEERPLSRLSTGQMRRAFLARALVGHPLLLLLDEPCAGLDAAGHDQFLALLADLAARPARPASPASPLMCLATHHRQDLPPCFDRLLWLEDGRATYAGPRAGGPELPA